jgi:hypothetical protein
MRWNRFQPYCVPILERHFGLRERNWTEFVSTCATKREFRTKMGRRDVPAFPGTNRNAYNWLENKFARDFAMPLSGEAIRLMNYIDDVAVTLRRVLSFVPTLSAEERMRVSEHLKHSKPNAEDVAKALSE